MSKDLKEAEALQRLSLWLDLKPHEGPRLNILVTTLSPKSCKFVVLNR